MRLFGIVGILWFLCLPTWAQKPSFTTATAGYTTQKVWKGKGAAVVSAHHLASEAGVWAMQQGGNAIDAAIATQWALAVVFPGAGNIGGGGFMVAKLVNGKTIALDYREKAPSKAHRDLYLDKNGNARLDKSQEGHLAAGVPGTPAGLFKAHQYAKLPMSVLLMPAIFLAEKGFAITALEARNLNGIKDQLVRLNTKPTAFLKDTPWQEGDLLLQPELANTLKRIQQKGRDGFYKGETAQLIVAEMKRGNGIISKKDLKNYEAAERAIVKLNYKGFDLYTMPLPSSGGVLLPQMLHMVADKGLDKLAFHAPEAINIMVEAERRAYADRAEYLGDMDFVKVPVKRLTSEAYARERMADFKPGVAGASTVTKPGVIAKQSEETTHLSVIDEQGNMVAVTTTLNGNYGSKTVVGGAGFLLNNEMDDFSVKPGVPNMYGAIGGEANAIAPGKRMLSSMTPTLVEKNGKPFMIVGTPGGTTITTSVFQSILNVIDFRLSAFDAVNQPKFHHQWLPDVIFVEPGFPDEAKRRLKAMGYTISERGPIGRTELILIKEDGTLEAVADRRGDDAVVAISK